MTDRTFTQTPDAARFSAYYAMSQWLADRGFSLGRMQAHEPAGILFGAYDIQKWRNLDHDERVALDAIANGNYRDGPIVVRLTKLARNEARIAFNAEMPPEDHEVERWAEDNFVSGDE